MVTLVWLFVTGTAAWVYWDATKKGIGRQIDGPGMNLKQSPLAWAIGTILLSFIFGPWYYSQRDSLIKKAENKPVIVSGKFRLGVCIAIGVVAAIPFFVFGDHLISRILWGLRSGIGGLDVLFHDVTTCLYLIASGVWAVVIYWDATKHHIGSDPNSRKLTDASPLEWAVGVLLAWIVAFPLYLVRRKSLIAIAQENPVDTSGTQKKAVFGVLGALMLVVMVSGLFGDSKMISMVKNGQLNDYPGVTIGHLLDKSYDDVEWEEQEGEGGIEFVTATGTFTDEDGTRLVSLKFKAIGKTNTIQPLAVYLDGNEMPPFALEQLFQRMYSRHGPNS